MTMARQKHPLIGDPRLLEPMCGQSLTPAAPDRMKVR
ncbi:predicted protein [Botrytis cinerea T4]|uniref:Uncharacterized protein n=1 Tax=Botryotinia fuckeliana (strain T4) TaxID=999810 RepID=G2XZR6_BOTF4|nr:predicted protein [Botrytis cinerea T4]